MRFPTPPFTWICAALIPLAVIRSARTVIPFIRTHWLFSYEFGFLKRGLPGELLRRMGISTADGRMDILALILFLAVAAALLWVFSAPVRKNPGDTGAWWFLLWAGTSSATLQRFAWDSGRYDGIGVLLMLGGITLSRKLKGNNLALFLNVLLGLLMLLVHEGQLLMFIPLMLAFWAMESEKTKVRGWAFSVGCSTFAFIFLTLTAIMISQRGILQDFSHQEFIDHLRTLDPLADPLAARIPLRDLADNQRYTLSLSFRKTVLPHHLLFLVGSAPLFFLWTKRFQNLPCTGNHHHHILIRLAALSPLALYVVGVDHFRWWALAFNNLFLVEAIRSKDEQPLGNLVTFCRNYRTWIALASVSALIVGSYGDTYSFALFKWVMTALRN